MGWEPGNEFERRLHHAVMSGDAPTAFGLLRNAEFALPITPVAAAGLEPPRWTTGSLEERTFVLAFTSPEAMSAVMGPVQTNFRVQPLAGLAAGWPNPHWGLAINPELPSVVLLDPGSVGRLAAPPLDVECPSDLSEPGPWMQKLLRTDQIVELLAASPGRVSGYVQRAADTEQLSTPDELIAALGRTAERDTILAADGSVTVLRWPAAGAELYRSAYGATDSAGMVAMEGWVVEEPPFTGTGFAPNVDVPIREYKVAGLLLPHGALMVQIAADGRQTRRTYYSGDLRRWLLVQRSAPPSGDPLADDPLPADPAPEGP